ncbi:MAG TPA: hypothetical protein VLV49_00735 [Terriglobales bacterium]|nr:hypothetical protein [Terriglobales bacterium]
MISALLLLPATALAQDQTTPKVDVFAGYQWVAPTAISGKVPTPYMNPNTPIGENIPGLNGLGSALTYNFDPHWGLEGDVGYNWSKFGSVAAISAGPRFMLRGDTTNFFLHTLLSYAPIHVNGLTTSNGIGALLGGGMDLKMWPHVHWRLFEVDYMWSHQNYADFAVPQFPNLRRPSLQGVRLRSGLVFDFGGAPVVPPAVSCSVQPSEVMVGEPITATANATNFNPKHTLTYNWSSTGGKVAGKDASATIDTNGVSGGSYTVTANVTDPKAKKNNEASCSASFTVKEPPKNPPTMSCTANPTSVQVGGTSDLSCTCTSPDNVPVTVSGWTATSGTVSGNGSTATLNTTGASAGPITVNATCTDSRGLTASSSAQVTVEVPPPPPPQASKLSECDFSKMAKIGKPWRVDNECKAILDDVAQRLQHEPDSKLVIVGNAEPTEKRRNLAAERAVNAKAYLSGGEAKQAIDASRIETRTGSAGTQTAEFWVVPAGATFSGEGTQAVDEMKVKPVPDHPRPAAKKKAMKK